MKYILTEAYQNQIEAMYEKIRVKIKAEHNRIQDKIPYISAGGKYLDDKAEKNTYWWTNGFWCGILWQMFRSENDITYRQTAEVIENKLALTLYGFDGLDHDTGFLFLHTAVADYRMTGNPGSLVSGKHAANLLAGRYNPLGRFIRAWNDWGTDTDKQNNAGWIIIDTMMNLPLLYWASEVYGDPRYAAIAVNHADTALEKLVRADGSCNHIACLNPENGDVISRPGGQGYSEGSSWTRGQAWALYGFALSYRYTKKREYLDTAKKIAYYFIANAALYDYKTPIDFRSPYEPLHYDSTAAVCAVCGLLEIASFAEEFEKDLYINSAVKLLTAADSSFCDWNPETDGILGYGSVSYFSNEKHVSLIYGDYFLVEAVLRLLDKDFLIW